MEINQEQNNGGINNSMFWIIVKIAFVILIVFLGIKFFSEKSSQGDEKGFVERKKTNPKNKDDKDDK
jgi:hypothetical protein